MFFCADQDASLCGRLRRSVGGGILHRPAPRTLTTRSVRAPFLADPRGKLAEACERFGIAYQTAANGVRVCKAFESSRRREELTFGHYESVANHPDAPDLLHPDRPADRPHPAPATAEAGFSMRGARPLVTETGAQGVASVTPDSPGKSGLDHWFLVRPILL